jgi:hypothetical protein
LKGGDTLEKKKKFGAQKKSVRFPEHGSIRHGILPFMIIVCVFDEIDSGFVFLRFFFCGTGSAVLAFSFPPDIVKGNIWITVVRIGVKESVLLASHAFRSCRCWKALQPEKDYQNHDSPIQCNRSRESRRGGGDGSKLAAQSPTTNLRDSSLISPS